MKSPAEIARAASQIARMARRSPIRTAVIAFALTAELAACSRTPSVMSQSAIAPRPSESPLIPKIIHPVPVESDLDKRVSFTKNGVESSMGTGVAADFTDIGIPIYPTMKPADTYVIKHVDKASFGMTIQGTIAASAATVDAWYAHALGPSFKSGRMRLLGGEVGSFSRRKPGDNESVLVQAERDAQTGAEAATLTLTVTKRR